MARFIGVQGGWWRGSPSNREKGLEGCWMMIIGSLKKVVRCRDGRLLCGAGCPSVLKCFDSETFRLMLFTAAKYVRYRTLCNCRFKVHAATENGSKFSEGF